MVFDLIIPEIDFLILLTVAVIIAILVKKYIKMPYTVALLICGMIISIFHFTHISLTKEIIFFFFLPPLLFEGAIRFDINNLKENFKYIGSLAFFGLIITTIIVGFLAHWLLNIPLLYAMLFGAIISPTDPISVLALFKRLGVDKKLSLIVEGESIFNDGLGIVLFGLVLGLVETGSFSLTGTIKEFILVVVGGIVVGIILGYFAYNLLKGIDDHVVEVLITIILAYACFLIAEHMLHVSGVIAVVVAGLMIGNHGKRFAMSPSTRISINQFWETVAFIVNSLIFILIGMSIPITTVFKNWYLVVIGILAVLVARSLGVYVVMFILNLFNVKEKTKIKWMHVINWGGLHGSVPIALILGLPAIAYKQELAVMVYGVVFFSLVIQGFTMSPLIKWLKILRVDAKEKEYEYYVAKRVALKKALLETKKLFDQGGISKKKADQFNKEYTKQLKMIKKRIDKIDTEAIIHLKRSKEVRRKLLLLEKSIYQELLDTGSISDDNAHKLISEVDNELDKYD